MSGDILGLIGQTLGEYQIHEELGRGGMAVVYKGYDPSLERWVAIKTLPQESSSDRDLVSRFGREAKAMGALNHTNIVQIIGSGEDRGLHYFVMEFVEGPSLQELLKQEQLSMDLMFDIATQVCDGLEYAHKKGIVHRDIKPGNVLYEQGTGLAKIADFGIARLTHKPEEMITLTATNVGMGTVNYMAPEQKTDAANVDHRADIYSLGVVVYEMFTGRLPMGRFKLPSQLNPKLPRGLDEIVTRSLEPDPVDRYGAMSELREGLVAAQATAGGGTLIRSVRDAAERTLTAMVGGGGGGKIVALLGCFVLLAGLGGGAYAVKRFVIDPQQVATKTEDPTKTEDTPSKTEDTPSKTESVPAKTEDPPAKTEDPPAKTEDPPAKTEDPPAKTEDPPAKTEDPPAKTEDPPAKTEDPPAKTEDPPAKTEDPPTKTEDPPAKTEDPPAKTEDPPAKTEDPPAKTDEAPVEPKETPIAAVDVELAKRKDQIARERSSLRQLIAHWKGISASWVKESAFASAKADLAQPGTDVATLERLEAANRDLPKQIVGALQDRLTQRLKALADQGDLPGLVSWATEQLRTFKKDRVQSQSLGPETNARRAIFALKAAREQEVRARAAQATAAIERARARVSQSELAPALRQLEVAATDAKAGDLAAAAQAYRSANEKALSLAPSAPFGFEPQHQISVSTVWNGIYRVTALSAVGGSGPGVKGDRFVAIGYRQASKDRVLLVADSAELGIAGRDPVTLSEEAFTVAVDQVQSDRAFSCYVGEQDVIGKQGARIRKLNVTVRGQVRPSELRAAPFLEFPATAGRLHDLAVAPDGTLVVLMSDEVLVYRGTQRIRQIPLTKAQAGLSEDAHSKILRKVGPLRLPRRLAVLADGSFVVSGLKPIGSSTWYFEARELNKRLSSQWQFLMTVIPPPGRGEIRTLDFSGQRPSPGALIPVSGGVVGFDHGANFNLVMSNLRKLGQPKANFFRYQPEGDQPFARINVLVPRQHPYLALDAAVSGESFVVLGTGATSLLGGDLESYLRAWDPEGRSMLYVYRAPKGR